MIDIDAAQVIYGILAAQPAGEWTGIPAVRDLARELGIGRDLFDATVVAMYALRVIAIVPECNQKTLTDADRYNGVRIPGGDVQHLIMIG